MVDRKKVIKGLECCVIDGGCGACPYDSFKDCPGSYPNPETLMKDALALLKAQEPRVVTEADFENADAYGFLPVWVEYKDDSEIICDCITKVALADMDNGYHYRYWTSCPTDEVRRATPWMRTNGLS